MENDMTQSRLGVATTIRLGERRSESPRRSVGELFIECVDQIQSGVFIVNQDERIVAWNRWLAQRSGIDEHEAVGRKLTRVMAPLFESRVHRAICDALEKGLASFLSHSLNRSPLSLFSEGRQGDEEALIPQRIEVIPILEDGNLFALVQITDVSTAVNRELLFRRMASEAEDARRRLAAMNEKLNEVSRTDHLTGVLNRRSLDSKLVSEWERMAREGKPVSFLLIDIDNFKLYNDTYGHQAGDECLQRVAKAIDTAVYHPGDIVARYGGEEFCVLLPGTGEAGAFSVAERIRADIEELREPHRATVLGVVTVSIGGCSRIAGADADPAEIVRSADAKLYEAKDDGRNCVKVGNSTGRAKSDWRATFGRAGASEDELSAGEAPS